MGSGCNILRLVLNLFILVSVIQAESTTADVKLTTAGTMTSPTTDMVTVTTQSAGSKGTTATVTTASAVSSSSATTTTTTTTTTSGGGLSEGTSDTVSETNVTEGTTLKPMKPSRCVECVGCTETNNTCLSPAGICFMTFSTVTNLTDRGCSVNDTSCEISYPGGMSANGVCNYCCSGELCNDVQLTLSQCLNVMGSGAAEPRLSAYTMVGTMILGGLTLFSWRL